METSHEHQAESHSGLGLDCSRDYELALELSRDPDCTADEQVAIKLQREFDRENELSQKFEESKMKDGKKTAVLSADPYNYYTRERLNESSDEEEDDDDIREFATNLLYGKTYRFIT